MKNILILIAFVLLFQGKVCAIKGTSVPGIEESFLISSGQALQKNDLREGTLQKLKFSVQKFWKNHQQKIIIGGTVVTAIVFVGMGIALLKERNNTKLLEKLVDSLENDIKSHEQRLQGRESLLQEVVKEKEELIKRIKELESQGNPERASNSNPSTTYSDFTGYMLPPNISPVFLGNNPK